MKRSTSRRHFIVLTCAWMGLICAPETARAQDDGWKIGLAREKITPAEPLRMSGYASRTEPSQGIESELFAKAMAFEDRQGNRAIWLTTDLIGFPAAITEPTCQLISQKTGLARHQILLNASHTHTGPSLSLDEGTHDYPEKHARATVKYTQDVQQKLVDISVASLNDLAPAKLSLGMGVATFVMNRREFTDRGVILGFNPRGHVDRSVPVLRVTDPNDKLRAVLYQTACHNTTLGGKNMQISGDFAGYSQEHIERNLEGVQAMFVQGCAGDANPFPRGSYEISRHHGRTLGDEVLRVLEGDCQAITGPLKTMIETVELPLQSAMTKEDLQQLQKRGGGWRRFVASKMLEKLEAGESLQSRFSTSIALWQFGDSLTMVGLPGEVVVDYVALIEQAIGQRKLWVSAYNNDVFGYLPSARVLAEGGYETRGLYYGGIGLFAPHAQDVVIDKIKVMAAAAGRTFE